MCERIDRSAILEPHVRRTGDRASECGTTLIATDLSDFKIPLGDTPRQGFVRLGNKQGFRVAASLALAGDGSNRPLGLLNFEAWADKPKKTKKGRRKKAGRKPKGAAATLGRTRASRWVEFAASATKHLGGRSRAIHVMDREAGAFELFAGIDALNSGFVIRLTKERVVELDDDPGDLINVREAIDLRDAVFETTVKLSKRRKQFLHQINPPRESRTARLACGVQRIRLRRPQRVGAEFPAEMTLNLVWVREIDPPEGEEPVEWLLATNEPVTTIEDVRRIIDIYRARWSIEEFFKALKTGCKAEERQIESLDALLRLMNVFCRRRMAPTPPSFRVSPRRDRASYQRPHRARSQPPPGRPSG